MSDLARPSPDMLWKSDFESWKDFYPRVVKDLKPAYDEAMKKWNAVVRGWWNKSKMLSDDPSKPPLAP
jgi:hypothetical protein